MIVPVGGAAVALELSGIETCGVVGSLEKISSVAVSVPPTVGVAVTAITQTTCATRVVPQELVSEKSVAFAPLMEIAEMFRVLVPLAIVTTEIGEVCPTPTVESNSVRG